MCAALISSEEYLLEYNVNGLTIESVDYLKSKCTGVIPIMEDESMKRYVTQWRISLARTR